MKYIINTPKQFVIFFLLLISLTFLYASGGDRHAKKDIVETAVEAGKFKTLATALEAADLVGALQAEGPYTVFAPTDEAFAKLPEGTVAGLLKDKEALKKVLLYHVVSGNVTADKVVTLDKAETLAGQNVMISVKDGKVMINNSQVITADVVTSNGVIHIIDTVLLPE